jgi:hypothetical protein
MSNYIWPYYSTSKKAFFKDGKNKIIVERKSKHEFEVKGRTKKTLLWNIGEVNLEEVKLHRGFLL